MSTNLDHIKDLFQDENFIGTIETSKDQVPTKDIYEYADEFILPNEASSDDLLPLVQETFAILDKAENKPLGYEPDYLMENALLLEKNGDYELARNIYEALSKKGILIPDTIVRKAKTYEMEKSFDQAIKAYEEAIAFSSKFEIFEDLALLQIKLGKDFEASQTLQHALGLIGLDDEKRFNLHKALGNCFTRISDFSKAELHYKRAFDIRPNSDTLQVNVGSLALQKQDLHAAHEHFQRAIALNAKNAKAFCGLGMLELSKNNSSKAHDYFLKSVELNPSDLGVIFNLVRCAYDIKKYQAAREALDRYIKNNPVNTNILYSYAGILYHMERYDEALVQVECIFSLNPDHTGGKELKELILSRSRN